MAGRTPNLMLQSRTDDSHSPPSAIKMSRGWRRPRGHRISEENDFVLKLAKALKGSPDQVWIGYRRRSDGRTFYWVTGAPRFYTNWTKGEPSNIKTEFVYMYVRHRLYRPQGKWNYSSCSGDRLFPAGYVCEMPQRQEK
ncbi:mannose-binding protein-like [Nematostella vectensis]|uniref:mannose-binding protein-like n=1 Tax=Nematostella vectensis TaxID=45351 RepID=UPI002076EC02|nr:mannose-binding protein-like [Nematostella vectensis]